MADKKSNTKTVAEVSQGNGAPAHEKVVGLNLWDGDANLGAAVHNLPASENGGSNRYDSWYDFIKVDLGTVQRVHRARATLPGSRNVNAAAGHHPPSSRSVRSSR